jgi:acyl dehydratase
VTADMRAAVRRTVAVGTEIPAATLTVTREIVAMFCGAALDFAGPHRSRRIARSVGLPDLIGHGALTTAKALSVLNEWTGDPTAVVDSHARYVQPVAVPDDDIGAVLVVSGVVTGQLDANHIEVSLRVASPDGQELATIRAVVRLT